MAQNVTIMGASYSDVPAVTLPKTGGGTARFTDVTPTNAVAADVASGKTFFLADGSQATGTASGGGGTTEEPVRDVNFIDYDGKIVYSYSAADFQQLSAMPANPSHAGLTAQGWNWSLSDAKTYVASYGKLWIGQMYITQSGDTEIDVDLIDGNLLSPVLSIAVNGEVLVDWGDNTTLTTVTGSSLSTRISVQHTYASTGKYTIAIHVVSGEFSPYTNNGSYLFLGENASADYDMTYSTRITAIRIGAGVTTIQQNAFKSCINLEYVTIPNSITAINGYAFFQCFRLKCITIPSGITTIEGNVFQSDSALGRVSLPREITRIKSNAFYGCTQLREVTIPSLVTKIDTNCFYGCSALADIIIPSPVTSIGSYAFYNTNALVRITIPPITNIAAGFLNNPFCLTSLTIPSSVTNIEDWGITNAYSLRSLHVMPTVPPTIGSLSFRNLPPSCVIYVPSASLADYKSETNWSQYASQMQGE